LTAYTGDDIGANYPRFGAQVLDPNASSVYNQSVRFEWDSAKAAKNLRKHRVSFEEASGVFWDPLAVTGDDPDHSEIEERLITFGLSSAGQLLVVSHTEIDDTIRIISARNATRHERKIYEEG